MNGPENKFVKNLLKPSEGITKMNMKSWEHSFTLKPHYEGILALKLKTEQPYRPIRRNKVGRTLY